MLKTYNSFNTTRSHQNSRNLVLMYKQILFRIRVNIDDDCGKEEYG